jgi:hypothetical protein
LVKLDDTEELLIASKRSCSSDGIRTARVRILPRIIVELGNAADIEYARIDAAELERENDELKRRLKTHRVDDKSTRALAAESAIANAGNHWRL